MSKKLRYIKQDKLPQLWNVFIGNMLFVDYRPERLLRLSLHRFGHDGY
jgi:lipopolysaccharide/colanic/teichoic acid biosynthesis glycosyltransferase